MNDSRRHIAAIYVRVSTEEQANEGLSIAAQVETLKQYCNAYNIAVYDIYDDPGISGKDTINRPGLIRLLSDSAKALFDIVLVWKISRLSRSLKDLLQIIDIFERNNISFTSFSEKFDTSTPVGRMTLQLLGSIAEFERNTIVENVKLGLKEFARRGGKTGYVYGYDRVDKRLEVNEKEAAAVRLAYDLYLCGHMSLSNIAEKLNESGYHTKYGKSFRSDNIASMLDNPVYMGVNRHNIGTPFEYETAGAHDSIISGEKWQRTHQLRVKDISLSEKKHKSTNTFLNGIVYCTLCNSPMKLYYSKAKGRSYRYFKCSKHKKAFYINAQAVEEEVVKVFISVLSVYSVYYDILKEIEKILLGSESYTGNKLSRSLRKNSLEELLSSYNKAVEAMQIITEDKNTMLESFIGNIKSLGNDDLKVLSSFLFNKIYFDTVSNSLVFDFNFKAVCKVLI